jgi:asparagine synthase (glutamine-hydrolysing)
VLDQGSYRPHFVSGNDYDLLGDLPSYLASQKKATLAHSPSLMQMLHRKVQDIGLNVVLDGHGGDEVTSHGDGYPEQLAREGRWKALISDLRGSLQNEDVSWQGAFLMYWFQYGGLPSQIGQRLLYLARSIGLIGGTYSAPPELIESDLARRTEISERERQYYDESPMSASTERQFHFQEISSTIQPEALSELNLLASMRSVEPRFPFWDPRVVEFCLSVPSRVKRKQGVGRQILRSGLASVIPRRVRPRTDKTNFRHSVIHSLASSSSSVRDTVERMGDELAPYVNLETLHSAVERFEQDPINAPPMDLSAILQTLRLGYFLKRS